MQLYKYLEGQRFCAKKVERAACDQQYGSMGLINCLLISISIYQAASNNQR